MYSLIFFGTPAFALPSLEAVLQLPDCKVVAVITETDKPAGRGQKLQASPVKQFALNYELTVLQPRSMRGVAPTSSYSPAADDLDSLRFRTLLETQKIDIGITVAYGKILPGNLLETPRAGIINVHASLLPRWRGAAPIQRALLAGDAESGVCIMQTEKSLDTGPVFHQEAIPLSPTETYATLHDRLAQLGAEALVHALPDILAGTLTATPQATAGITYADKWEVGDCVINWDESADAIDRRVRASNPTPGARCRLAELPMKIFAVEPAPQYSYPESPSGTIVDVQRKKIVIACGEGEFICPTEIQLAGKKRMSIAAAMQGFSFDKGSRLL